MSHADPLQAARERVLALRASLQREGSGTVRLVETHISWVLLTDRLAYKMKKPVHLPFLDFESLAARRHFCAEELRLNRRLSPWLYIGLVDICEGSQGPRLGGPGNVVDVAVAMRRFPDGALWSERLAAGRLAPTDIDGFAESLAAFHRDAQTAPADSEFGSRSVHDRVAGRLLEGLPGVAARAGDEGQGAELAAWLKAEAVRLAAHRERRRQGGWVRECHGDLHLANIVQIGAVASAFDCVEFDPDLRWIDVIEDAAFLMMDLLACGASGLAFRFINAWLEATGDYESLRALRYHLVCRALVRAEVMAVRAEQGNATASASVVGAYYRLAGDIARGADPRLAITRGLPGSGKSFLAAALCESAGAIRIRSDVERKRLFGLAARQSSRHQGLDIYDEAATRRTYARLRAAAAQALAGGWPTVVDAAFLRRSERAEFDVLANTMELPFAIFDCRAPLDVLRDRLVRRGEIGGDASEADLVVLERLIGSDEPLVAEERARAVVVEAGDVHSVARTGARWLEQRRPP